MTVRFATEADVIAIYGFINLLEDTVFDFDTFKQYYLQNLKEPHYVYLVAEENSTVIGFISCHGQLLLHHLDMVFEIQELFVDETYRSKKVGALLLEHLETILKNRGHVYLEVTSNKLRTEAHRFYTNNGFNESHYRFTKKLR